MVFGTYHFVSKGYLQTYVDESVYRYNTREWDESARFSDMFGCGREGYDLQGSEGKEGGVIL